MPKLYKMQGATKREYKIKVSNQKKRKKRKKEEKKLNFVIVYLSECFVYLVIVSLHVIGHTTELLLLYLIFDYVY